MSQGSGRDICMLSGWSGEGVKEGEGEDSSETEETYA